MTQKMKMGYVEVATQPGCRLFPAGATVRGHVYHFSEMARPRPYSSNTQITGALMLVDIAEPQRGGSGSAALSDHQRSAGRRVQPGGGCLGMQVQERIVSGLSALPDNSGSGAWEHAYRATMQTPGARSTVPGLQAC